MDVIHSCVAGLDVHKQTVVACVRRIGEGGRVWKEVRTFDTATRHLQALRSWLKTEGVTHVAMESTGVFWKPVYNCLEEHFEQVLLVNARDIKQVPGRKTDVKDCEWIAQLLQFGLLRGSFVPPREQRELRDLTRHRTTLVQEHNRVVNRLHKVLQDANIKLSSVATDILGVSGRQIIEAIERGEHDPVVLADLARRRLREKIPELRVALEAEVREHHRFLIRMLLDQLDFLSERIDRLSDRIQEVSRPPIKAAVARLTTIKGVGQRVAETIAAELGISMTPFPSHKHCASWAGVCPGNNQSAGKRKSGRTSPGNRWLRRALAEAAWAASRSRGTYLAAQFRRIAARRGKKRAIVAVSHTLLVAVYHMLSDQVSYIDLGGDHFDRLQPERLTNYHVSKLRGLGYDVTLTPATSAA
jgi:transposase